MNVTREFIVGGAVPAQFNSQEERTARLAEWNTTMSTLVGINRLSGEDAGTWGMEFEAIPVREVMVNMYSQVDLDAAVNTATAQLKLVHKQEVQDLNKELVATKALLKECSDAFIIANNAIRLPYNKVCDTLKLNKATGKPLSTSPVHSPPDSPRGSPATKKQRINVPDLNLPVEISLQGGYKEYIKAEEPSVVRKKN